MSADLWLPPDNKRLSKIIFYCLICSKSTARSLVEVAMVIRLGGRGNEVPAQRAQPFELFHMNLAIVR